MWWLSTAGSATRPGRRRPSDERRLRLRRSRGREPRARGEAREMLNEEGMRSSPASGPSIVVDDDGLVKLMYIRDVWALPDTGIPPSRWPAAPAARLEGVAGVEVGQQVRRHWLEAIAWHAGGTDRLHATRLRRGGGRFRRHPRGHTSSMGSGSRSPPRPRPLHGVLPEPPRRIVRSRRRRRGALSGGHGGGSGSWPRRDHRPPDPRTPRVAGRRQLLAHLAGHLRRRGATGASAGWIRPWTGRGRGVIQHCAPDATTRRRSGSASPSDGAS